MDRMNRMTENDEAAVRAAVAGELRLLDPRVRASDEAVTALLDPEFLEFGASGRRYDRASVLAVTSAPDDDAEPVVTSEMSGVRLAPDIVHLTYVWRRGGRRVRRSSLWRRSPDAGWRMYFHQGTPAHGGEPPA
ncbi:nuclear transport factor 2 family protein [Streptomyces sp. NPDC001478]